MIMYIFEISDILFFIKNLKNPTSNFNINTFHSCTVGNTRYRSCGVKLTHNAALTKNVISDLTELVIYGIHSQLLI